MIMIHEFDASRQFIGTHSQFGGFSSDDGVSCLGDFRILIAKSQDMKLVCWGVRLESRWKVWENSGGHAVVTKTVDSFPRKALMDEFKLAAEQEAEAARIEDMLKAPPAVEV